MLIKSRSCCQEDSFVLWLYKNRGTVVHFVAFDRYKREPAHLKPTLNFSSHLHNSQTERTSTFLHTVNTQTHTHTVSSTAFHSKMALTAFFVLIICVVHSALVPNSGDALKEIKKPTAQGKKESLRLVLNKLTARKKEANKKYFSLNKRNGPFPRVAQWSSDCRPAVQAPYSK